MSVSPISKVIAPIPTAQAAAAKVDVSFVLPRLRERLPSARDSVYFFSQAGNQLTFKVLQWENVVWESCDEALTSFD